MPSEKKLFLLDAYALIYRSYYAFIRNPRFNSKGLNTSAIFGFVNTLDEVLKNEKPSHIAVVFDPPSPTFRHEMFSAYKANRDETPEDIKRSVPWIRNLLEAYNIPVLEAAGYEADDVIGTLARKAEKRGYTTYMMTPDKDFCQLVSGNIFLYKPKRSGNDAEVWGPDEVMKHYDIDDPQQVIDVLAMMGDASDNIPGVPGIGEKTAKKIISKFKSVQQVLENLDEFKGKQRENIEQSAEKLRLSRELVTIALDAPVELDEKMLALKPPDIEKLKKLFAELEFRTAGERILSGFSGKPPSGDPVQGSLFDHDSTGSGNDTEDGGSGLDTIKTVDHKYHLAEGRQEREKLIDTLSRKKEFCFDTETDGLDPHESGLVGLSFCCKPHEAWYVPVPAGRAEAEAVIGEFRELFENEKIAKVGQNIKFDILVLAGYGIGVKGRLFDTMLAHYLLEPGLRHNMNYLAEVYLGYAPVSIEELIGKKGRGQKSMRDVEPDTIKEYAAEDADITWQLKEILEKELEKEGMVSLAGELEMPLATVLASMEKAGVRLDSGSLESISGKLSHDLVQIEKEVYELAGTEFNLASPKQLGEILFERMKIVDNAKRTKTKQFSTNEEVLDKIKDKHPIIPKILEYRGLKKLLSTYVDALPKLVNRRTGRIHTSFNQAVTSTGRLSSTNPNLQNIPIREERGREIRKAFIARDSDHLLLAADYSQIELRLMAHMSGDKGMIEAFSKNEDIHAATAAKIFSVGRDEVNREMRAKAKTANFGIIYGISAFGLSQRLSIPREEAKKLIDGYFSSYPAVKEYMDRCISDARDKGYVVTIKGRRRQLPDINSRNSLVRGNAERNAINAPIQGSAADIIKLAMVKIHEELGKRKLKTKMILQVHDELVFDVYRPELDEVRELVTDAMQSVVSLSVPLTVDTGTGSNWLEAH
ncbi:MAG: DNA polymerase I [Marinilabiliales bacterium]|nr:MAG: DNA polymerase I [Marinilabiliales bacterium]